MRRSVRIARSAVSRAPLFRHQAPTANVRLPATSTCRVTGCGAPGLPRGTGTRVAPLTARRAPIPCANREEKGVSANDCQNETARLLGDHGFRGNRPQRRRRHRTPARTRDHGEPRASRLSRGTSPPFLAHGCCSARRPSSRRACRGSRSGRTPACSSLSPAPRCRTPHRATRWARFSCRSCCSARSSPRGRCGRHAGRSSPRTSPRRELRKDTSRGDEPIAVDRSYGL